MSNKTPSTPQNQGEGNVDAARRYDEATRNFVKSGQVDQAARDAAPKDEAQARELRNAEQAGERRAKEEDPAVVRDLEKPSKPA